MSQSFKPFGPFKPKKYIEMVSPNWINTFLKQLFTILLVVGCVAGEVQDPAKLSEALITLSSISPESGISAGGYQVTLYGSGFTSSTKVSVGAVSCSVVASSDSQITCEVGTLSNSSSHVDVRVQDPRNGTATLKNVFGIIGNPIVTGVSPSGGTTAGLGVITILGQNFTNTGGAPTVTVGGNICASPTVLSSSAISCQVAPHALGVVDIVVTNPGGLSGMGSNLYEFRNDPIVTSVVPNFGISAGGETLSILGSDFSNHAGLPTVRIGGVLCSSVTYVNSGELSCVSGAMAAGSLNVVVTNPSGASDTLPSGFVSQDAPEITGLSQNYGSIAGGTAITITGTNFSTVGGNPTVMIGTAACTVGVVTTTTIACTTTATTAGMKAVTVTNADTQSDVVLNAFTYQNAPVIANISPVGGVTTGNTSVTIQGTGFSTLGGNPVVTVGGITCSSVVVSSANQLACTTGAGGSGLGDVVVTNADAQSNTAVNLYEYLDAPTFASITPDSGTSAGGNVVTIMGSRFSSHGGAPTVVIGGNACYGVNYISANEINCTSSAHSAGEVDVVISNASNLSVTSTNAFTYQVAPTIASISPESGPVLGSTLLTINGGNFSPLGGGPTVSIEGAACTGVSVINSTQITCTTGASTAGLYDVRVENNDGQYAVLTNSYQYQNNPTISGVDPSFGPLGGATTVTISGSNFSAFGGFPEITVGGNNCGSINYISSTSLQCTLPSGVSGATDVVVTNVSGLFGTATGGYTYQDAPTFTSIAPDYGDDAGGTVVTITGTGFSTLGGSPEITLGGNSCTLGTINPLETIITCTTAPHAAGAVDLEVTLTDGQNFLEASIFTYQAAPTIASISPVGGVLAGGDDVTITGTNFSDAGSPPEVTVDGIDCTTVSFVSDTELTCETPAGAAGVVDIEVTNADGQSVTGTSLFEYRDDPTVVSLNPVFGPAGGGTSVTIIGTNFSNHTDDPVVSIGGVVCATLTYVDPTELTCVTAAAMGTGDVDVIVTNTSGQTITAVDAFESLPAVELDDISPVGSPLLGTGTLTLTGNNFSTSGTGPTVGIGGEDCPILTVNPTTITCTIPASVAGIVDVVVTNPDGVDATLASAFEYLDDPTFVSVTPDYGALSGGTDIIIDGTNFSEHSELPAVTVDGVACTSVAYVDPTSITCTTGAMATTGAVNIVYTNANGGTFTAIGAFTTQAAPSLASVDIGYGPIAGGTAIVLTGADISDTGGNPTIEVGGVACMPVAYTDPTTVGCTVGAHAVGEVDIVLTQADGQVATLTDGFTYQAAPTVASISPVGGVLAGATSVTITGTNFSDLGSNPTVTIGAAACGTVAVNSATELTCVTGADAGGIYTVTVTNADSQSGVSGSNLYEYRDDPTVTAITPDFGPIAGGTTVNIDGTNFSAHPSDPVVTIGGQACSNVIYNSAISLTCDTPATMSAGAQNVVVTNASGQNGTLASGFEVLGPPDLDSINPTFGAALTSPVITLTGTAFSNQGTGITVSVGGIACQTVTFISATQVDCTIDASLAAGTHDVVVTNPDGSSSTLSASYQALSPPTLASISPVGGEATSGGTVVTLTGTNFSDLGGEPVVTLGGTPCASVNYVSTTSVECLTAPSGSGVVDVVLTNNDGQGVTLSGSYHYLDAPTVISVSPNGGPIAGGTSISITGTNFSNHTGNPTVTINGANCNTIFYASSTQIDCVTPAGIAGDATVIVTNPSTQGSVVTGTFTYADGPSVDSVSPLVIASAGSDVLTITGAGFVSGATVTVGGANCPGVTFVSSTSLTCTAPAGTPGSATLEVTNPDNQIGSLTPAVTYESAPTLSGIAPSLGPLTGGQLITLTGTDFGTSVSVSFSGGGGCSSVTRISDTQITCSTTSVGTISVTSDVTVTNTITGTTSTLMGAYTYIKPPTLTSILPATGGETGGTVVVLSGNDFEYPLGVTIGGNVCVIGGPGDVTSTSITCTTGVGTVGLADVIVTNPDGQSDSLTGAYNFTSDAILAWQGGPFDFGTTSAVYVTQTFTLENTGTADSQSVTLSLGGANSAYFSIVPATNTCSGVAIPAGGSCTIDVLWRAGSVSVPIGGPYSATVTASGTGMTSTIQSIQATKGP